MISELVEHIDLPSIALLCGTAPTPTLQRLGYIFDQIGAAALADEVHTLVGTGRRVELDTFSCGHQAGSKIFDDRWKVVVRRPLDDDAA